MAVIAATEGPKLPIQNYDVGPFKGSNGAFYVILLTNNEKEGACFKATDPTDTDSWSVQDNFHRPQGDETIPSAAMRLSRTGSASAS